MSRAGESVTGGEHAQRRFRELARPNAATLAAAVESFADQFRTHGERRLTALDPVFVGERVYREVIERAEAVRDGLRASLVALARGRGPASVTISERARACLTPALDNGLLPLMRLDGYLDPERGWQLLECNAWSPWCSVGAVVRHELAAKHMAEGDVMRRLGDEIPHRAVATTPLLLRSATLLAALDEGGARRVALVDMSRTAWALGDHVESTPAPPEELEQVLEALVADGWQAVRCAPSELEWADGLRHAGEPVHLIIPWGGLPAAMSRAPADHPLWRALGGRGVGSFDVWPLGSIVAQKAVLPMLSDPERHGLELDEEVAGRLARAVPWTRALEDGATHHEGQAIDLRTFVVDHREELVLKSAKGGGGQLVMLGRTLKPKRWERAVDRAMGRGWIAQQCLRSPTIEGGWLPTGETATAIFDLCPFVWSDGTVNGVLARQATGAVTNVTGGASLSAVFVVDDATS